MEKFLMKKATLMIPWFRKSLRIQIPAFTIPRMKTKLMEEIRQRVGRCVAREEYCHNDIERPLVWCES